MYMFSLLPAERCLSNNNEKSHNKKPNTAFVICLLLLYVLHKKSFPLTSFSVNVTKSAVSCGFGHIYWRNPLWKTFLDQSWFSACRYISIKATNWWCGFRWVWSGMLKEAIKILRSQKPKKVWSLFCACNFLFIKVINWLCKFWWVWSGMRKEVFKTLIS